MKVVSLKEFLVRCNETENKTSYKQKNRTTEKTIFLKK